MHSDDAARKDDASAASASPPAEPSAAPSMHAKSASPLRAALRDASRFRDWIAADRTRRRRASIGLALGLNALLFSALAVFGRFQIYVPSAPSDSISVVMVETESLLPEPRDPETIPEPEEAEPEPVKEPEILPDPAPDPAPTPEPELAPKPAPEPEPTLDLTPEESFAPPAEAEEAPFIDEPEPAPSEEMTLPTDAPAADEAPGEQAPAAEAQPLVEPIAQTPLEVTERGETEEKEEEEIAEIPPAGDEAFDDAPVYGRPRQPLPTVALPEGQTSVAPGQSGVVAIYCPEEFSDKEKAAECAGRVEIKSGWRPGASGEDWSQAVRLLKKDKIAGRAGVSPSDIYGPEAGGAIEDAAAAASLKDFRKSQDAINNQASDNSANIDRTLGRPDIGPEAVEPAWSLRDDPTISRKDAEKLRRALEEAEKEKAPKEDEAD